jgi:hypothetical protein
MISRRGAVKGLASAVALGVPAPPGAAAARFDAKNVPRGEWTRIHEQSSGDEVSFRRQLHGGAAFDSRRGRIVLFGSDEHGEDWTNSPLFFHVATLHWSQLYPNDDPSTYRVDRFGLPVAGPDGDHPWAMHTFGTVTYHEANDAIVVSIYPAHMQPGRFTNALAHIWPRVRRHPTWVLDLASGGWKPLPSPAIHFFPYATAYDPHRRVVMGYKDEGVFELRPQPIGWTKLTGPGLLGYSNSAVFDTRHHALLVFGSHENANDIVIYEAATNRHQKMPTPGLRPPKAQTRPMAYHAGVGQVAMLFDSRTDGDPALPGAGFSETWLYDLGRDAWTQHPARLPFRVGMNYNMVYDPPDDLLLLVAGGAVLPTSVWGLRL